MKNFYTLIAIIFIASLVSAQTRNVNPDKNKEAWILGGLRIPSNAELSKTKTIENVKIKSRDLPERLDNTSKQYFRPIFSQTDGCCAQASGVGYNFTYEINRQRGTSANVSTNQFPTHYTYNFLNGGSGSNGSWYQDGWDIIKANGCPTVDTYGGLAQDATYWMSGYDNYESGQENRVKEHFAIDVSTPEGLETLKHWMFDHLEGASDGSIVNFAAGISDGDYNITDDTIITKWHNSANHAMTFVGWDDNKEFDYNGDGYITNNIDINGDGIVNMQDWERGALIMVNSWGEGWGNYGKAYVMYKLLADPIAEGGIFANKVYGIKVKDTYTPQLLAKIKMTHSSRKKIKIKVGTSSNMSASEPDNEIGFPLFTNQGGDFDMRGTSSNAIEFTLDITPILSYVNSGEETKFFLIVEENDELSEATGEIVDFSIIDANDNESTSTQHNVAIVDNGKTYLTIGSTITFNSPEITTANLDMGFQDILYSQQLTATGGTAPYKWSLLIDYTENSNTGTFPDITSNQLTPTNDDDGYASQTLNFDFPFFGKTYNEIYISTDGSIIFEPNFSYLRSEEAIKKNKVISVFASDLMIYPANNDGIFYEGDANYATFRWKTALFSNDAANIDVAITLYPSGEIKFFYGNNITQGLDWASGISNGDGRSYLIASNSNSNNPSNSSLKLESEPFPMGMTILESGIFNGTPTEIGNWIMKIAVTDDNQITKVKSIPFEVGISSSVKNQDISKISVYPNPVKQGQDLQINSDENIKTYSIYNISGQKISTNKFSNTINTSTLPTGIYLLELNSENKIFREKILVK